MTTTCLRPSPSLCLCLLLAQVLNKYSGAQVTFRAVCQHLEAHLFAAASSDRNSEDPTRQQSDERLVLAIIESLERLLASGRVVERVGGAPTAATSQQLRARRRKGGVAPPRSPHVICWPPAVRFYDDDNDLDWGQQRVPPALRKTYEANAQYHDAASAAKAKLNIEVTVRGRAAMLGLN